MASMPLGVKTFAVEKTHLHDLPSNPERPIEAWRRNLGPMPCSIQPPSAPMPLAVANS